MKEFYNRRKADKGAMFVFTNLRKREEEPIKNKPRSRSGSLRGMKQGCDVYSAVAGITDTKDLLFAFFL
jgi:hypothetical protein